MAKVPVLVHVVRAFVAILRRETPPQRVARFKIPSASGSPGETLHFPSVALSLRSVTAGNRGCKPGGTRHRA